MKILIASDLYWPVTNGVSTFSRNLAQGMAGRGHEVLVIASSQKGKSHTEIDGKYKIARISAVTFPFYQNLRVSPAPAREVKKIIDDFKPDIIHIQSAGTIGFGVIRYANKLGIPVVSTNHAMPENIIDNLKMLAPLRSPITGMLRKIGEKFFAKSDYVTMPTQAAIDMFAKEIRKLKLPPEPVSNGIDLSQFKPGNAPASLYEKFGLPTDKPIITYVGRVDCEKHISVLVKAFDNILKKIDAHLLIVGYGTDFDNLHKLVDKMKLNDKVTFTGFVEESDKILLHKIGTVFAMPSPAELQSIVALEAMASGLPIVAVDAGAVKELCQDGRNGFLCHKDNVKEITEGLLKILTDKKLHDKMAAESLKIAQEHSLEHTLDRFMEIYQQTIISKKK